MRRALTAAAIVVAASLAGAAPAGAQGLLGTWGSIGDRAGRFDDLVDVAVDAKGYVYALDEKASSGRVQKFTADGKVVRQFGRPQDERDRFDSDQIRNAISDPVGIAVGPRDEVFVAEQGGDRTRVSVWSSRGRFLRSFGDGGDGPGQFSSAGGLALDGGGTTFLADRGRLGVFDARGGWVGAIGQDSDVLSPSRPADVALSGGRLFVADGDEVKVWSTTGAPLGRFGRDAEGGSPFGNISSLAFSGSTLYVADDRLSRVLVNDVQGDRVTTRGLLGGTPGGQPGQFASPVGIATDCRGSVYVADKGNYRIQRFGPAGARPCIDIAKDPGERFRPKLGGRRLQKFRSFFAVRPVVTCDRPCAARISGTMRIGRRSIKLRTERERLDFPDPTPIAIAPGERGTDAVAAATRRRRAVSARITVRVTDPTGRAVTMRARYRLR